MMRCIMEFFLPKVLMETMLREEIPACGLTCKAMKILKMINQDYLHFPDICAKNDSLRAPTMWQKVIHKPSKVVHMHCVLDFMIHTSNAKIFPHSVNFLFRH